jgi:hypothetical protein
VGWGWYYLFTVLDDYSRKILAWKLSATMRVEDVTEALDLARAATGVDRVRVEPKPRLLSDNGPCYVAKDLAAYPWEVERAIAHFVDNYNHERLHEAIGNVTPDDMYHGRQCAILSRGEKIKRLTLERRKKGNRRNAAEPQLFIALCCARRVDAAAGVAVSLLTGMTHGFSWA